MTLFEALPPASPRMGFFKAVSGWLDAAAVEFGPEGTMHYVQSSIAGITDRLYTTGMRERQIIFGDTEPLEQAIRDIDRAAAPRLLFITSSPVSEIIGADLETVARRVQPEVGARLSAWDRVPVEGTQPQGYAAAHERAAQALRQGLLQDGGAEKSGVLILGLGEADWNGAADLNELRRMVEAYFGLPCLNGEDGRYCLGDIPKAQCLLVIAPEAAALAKAAQELWGTPWHGCVPYGLDACGKLVSALERLLGQTPGPRWAAERREVKRSLAQFRDKLAREGQKTVFLDVSRARSQGWEAFLSNELGLAVSRPRPDQPALSTDGSVGRQPGIGAGELLLGCGLLCAMHPDNPSLCVEYPAGGQALFSRHIPLMGMRGVENTAALLFPLLQTKRDDSVRLQ